MTKLEMVQMGREFNRNCFSAKYNDEKITTYKYRGEIKTRVTHEWNAEALRIVNLLSEPMFICPECGKHVSFNALEAWLGDTDEDFLEDRVPCSLCYEEDMGEDL